MTAHTTTPRRPLASAKKPLRTIGAILVLAATLAATGCSPLPSETVETDASASTGPAIQSGPSAAAPKAAAKPTQPASATDALAENVRALLTKLGGATKSPNRGQMMAAMLEAGAAKGKVEVSIDRTPTGLAVDAIEAAAPVAGNCVIGQVRDGKAVVSVLPLLASGRCFVGDQR
ncbi:hypothetical protein [Arthrobacter sp.]|uniref:DUF6993 domain-containing protein n=1 Tax=Arthrobacter sp. TaxID=1667 RepID=UPI002589956D|nr:hypothetical protein [Arthrobacter sp.]